MMDISLFFYRRCVSDVSVGCMLITKAAFLKTPVCVVCNRFMITWQTASILLEGQLLQGTGSIRLICCKFVCTALCWK